MKRDDVSGTVETGAERFRVPREPRLRWSMLNPMTPARRLPPPMDRQTTFHLFWARNALFHGLRALNLKAGDTILVPAYHCASLVEPLLQYGAKVRFYCLDETCNADVQDIEDRIEESTRAVLVIHYFGFPQPIARLREMCDRRGLFLIEDCAHVLTGATGGRALGSVGDIATFSWRKFLPIYDGGQLVVNNPMLEPALHLVPPPLLLRLRIWKHVLDRKVAESHWSVPVLARMLRVVSRLGRALSGWRRTRSEVLTVNNYRLDFDVASINLAMSDSSQLVLRNTDLSAVAERRRRNYAYLQRAVGALPGAMPLFPDLPEGVCPWVFPLFAPGCSEFHRLLRARGIPAVTWGEVIHPELPLGEFPGAAFLYENLVFLPVHQSLTELELDCIVGAISGAVSSQG